MLLTGCVGSVADRMTTGPNAWLSDEQVLGIALQPELPGTTIGQSLRVPVDARGKDDAAELAVWVIEPTDERLDLTGDGTALRIREPATGQAVTPRGTVVILHGLWHHKGRPIYLLWARLFAAQGYRCVLIDHRAHGQSTGSRVSYGVHEAADTLQVIHALRRRGVIDEPLMLMGGSMGAATAIQAAALDSGVDSVVALAPYSSLDGAIESVAEAVFFTARLMPDCFWDVYARAVCRRNAMDLRQADNVRAARQASAPMLLIAAGEDDLIPPSHARAIRRAAPAGSRLFVVAGHDHRSIARQVPDELYQLVIEWLRERERVATADQNSD